MQRYAEWVIRRRLLVMALTLLVSVVLAAQVRHLEVVVDNAKFLPNDNPYVLATKEIERTFGFRYVVAIAITPTDGDAFSPLVLAKVQRITAAIRDIPGVVKRNVLSLAARRAKSIVGTAILIIITTMLVSSLSALTVLPAIILALRPRCVFDGNRRIPAPPWAKPRGENATLR